MTGNGSKRKSAPKKKKQRCKRYEDWISNENLVLLQGWAMEGLSNEQIAHNMGMSITTLYKWQKEHTEFADALKKGKQVVDFMMENALFRNGMNGNVAAQIFWLKNRKPDKWKEHQELMIEQSNDEAIKSWINALKD